MKVANNLFIPIFHNLQETIRLGQKIPKCDDKVSPKKKFIPNRPLWSPIYLIKRSRKCAFIDTIKRQNELDIEELKTAIQDRELWRERYV